RGLHDRDGRRALAPGPAGARSPARGQGERLRGHRHQAQPDRARLRLRVWIRVRSRHQTRGRSLNVRSILVLAVGGALAIASGLSAFSQVGQRIAPQQAAVAFPNGLAKANLASALYVLEMREAEDPTASPSDEVTALAFE